MKTLSRLFACASLAAVAIGPAVAQNQQIPVIDGPTYVMTYVEVVPSATANALAILKEYRDAARREPGAMFVDIMQEDGQPYNFVVSEVWQNRGAVATHVAAAAMKTMIEKVKPVALGPTDTRIHQAHSVTPPKAASANDVIVITHADVAGGNTQNLMNAFAPLSEASRKENGMVRYEILDEVPAHANHFRLYEEWSSMAAFEAHDRAAHTQTYRQTILPWLGTPYDQRLYRLAN
jgi:quinol monooxygenase YgiN